MKTRKWFPFLLTMLLACSGAQAQFIKSFGIKSGIAISDIHVTDLSHPGSALGLYYVGNYPPDNVLSPTVSLFANFLHEEHLGLQAELTYLHKGASRTMEIPITTAQYPDGTGEAYKVTTEFNFHYLALALAAQPRVSVGDAAFYAHIGPTANYLLEVANYGWLEQFTRLQLGYTLGLGIDLGRLFDGDLFLEVRYAGDFSPFYESASGVFEHVKLWNRSWTVCLGTSF
jgi:hypothetical protein